MPVHVRGIACGWLPGVGNKYGLGWFGAVSKGITHGLMVLLLVFVANREQHVCSSGPCLETTAEEEIPDIGQILFSTCIIVYTSLYRVVYRVVQMTDIFMVWTRPK